MKNCIWNSQKVSLSKDRRTKFIHRFLSSYHHHQPFTPPSCTVPHIQKSFHHILSSSRNSPSPFLFSSFSSLLMSRDPPSSGLPGPPPNHSPSAPPALRCAASFVSSLFSSPHAQVDDSSPIALNSELGSANRHSLTSPHSWPHCTHDTSTCVTCVDYQDCCVCSAACLTPTSD